MIDSARVVYSLLDPTIATDTQTNTSSSKSAAGSLDTLNDNPLGKKRLAYLENKYFLLDGTHLFASGSEDVGWESANLSNSTGVINEWVRFQFASPHASYGLVLYFAPESVAKDFTIVYYTGESVVHTTTVTNSTASIYQDNAVVADWTRIQINITKTANPEQRARLHGVVFGIKEEYNGDDIISITASKAISLTAGNDDSGEVEFQFFNSRTFDIQSIKDIPPEIQQNIDIDVWFSRGGVYVKFMRYRSIGTDVSDNGSVVTVSGYDELQRAGKSYFEIGTVAANKSLADWADEVAADSGLSVAYDSSLSGIYSDGYIGYVTHREALRLIAEAANCALYTDENGVINIKPNAATSPVTITEDDIIKGSYKVTNGGLIDIVIVERHTFTKSATATGLAEIQDIALTGSEQEIWVEYATFPAEKSSVASSANITINGALSEYYSDRAKIVFTGTAGQTGWITILGYAYATAKTSVTLGSGGRIKLVTNTLITRSNVAESVAAHQFARVNNIYDYVSELFIENDLELGQESELNGNDVYITAISRSMKFGDTTEAIKAVDK